MIIPCFNGGAFINEAIGSVLSYPDKGAYEIVIVNDGSTDPLTLAIFDSLESDGYKVIHQVNQGPAAARNAGVNGARGEYIMFLDCDNKIRKEYIEKSLSVMKSNEKVGVVYGNPHFIGEINRSIFKPIKFEIRALLLYNYIDMCAMVRRKAWESVGGLDENRLLDGHEDWEFWINLASRDWEFVYFNEALYDYRIRNNSLITQTASVQQMERKAAYIYAKHSQLVRMNYSKLYSQYVMYQNDQRAPFRSFVKFLYYKFLRS